MKEEIINPNTLPLIKAFDPQGYLIPIKSPTPLKLCCSRDTHKKKFFALLLIFTPFFLQLGFFFSFLDELHYNKPVSCLFKLCVDTPVQLRLCQRSAQEVEERKLRDLSNSGHAVVFTEEQRHLSGRRIERGGGEKMWNWYWYTAEFEETKKYGGIQAQGQ